MAQIQNNSDVMQYTNMQMTQIVKDEQSFL
jgi:hypothetical protein